MDCSVCGSLVDAPSDVIVHQVLACGECLSEFEVVQIEPLQVHEMPSDEEDWGQ